MADLQGDYAGLLDRARGGDAAALAELARVYEPELRILARVRLGAALRPYLDTLDLVQSVHRSLLAGLRGGRFDVSTPERLVALALDMVRRKAAMKWRKMRRQQRVSHGGAEELPKMLLSLTSPETDPARAAAMSDALAQVCRELTPVERRLVALRLEGLSTVGAAKVMNEDPDALRVRLSRLRRRLRDQGVALDWF